MKVMVVGSGGREHALAWKLGQSTAVDRVFCAPGNAGTANEMATENVPLEAGDIPGLTGFARQNGMDLVVVGPEQPLCDGLADALQDAGIRVFGPDRKAARLEGSKAFCKNILRMAGVPTGAFRVFSDPRDAESYVNAQYSETPDDVPLVVKADGLAAGKGVMVCSTRDEVFQAIDAISRQKVFGSAGRQFVIEKRMTGTETSVLAITDGKTIVTLPAAQDHKAAMDGDLGPNTGGMGACSPTPVVDSDMMHWIEEHVLVPSVHAMKRNRTPFRGLLFAGLMLTPSGPRVLEFNVRFGDPECQTILARLDSDLFELLMATAEGRLDEIAAPQWKTQSSLCVVMAAEGYPGFYRKGDVIRGLNEAAKVPNAKVFHAGTRFDAAGNVITSGGRVLGITALGETTAAAKLAAYQAVKCIRWEGAWCRKDIGDKSMDFQPGAI